MTTSTESQGWAGEEEETQGNPKRLQKKTPLGPQGERHGGSFISRREAKGGKQHSPLGSQSDLVLMQLPPLVPGSFSAASVPLVLVLDRLLCTAIPVSCSEHSLKINMG